MRIFGREPAWWLALVATAIQLGVALGLPLNDVQQGVLNGIVAAAAGFLTALAVDSEKILPAIVGLFQAGFAVAIAFGWNVSPEIQTAVVALVMAVGAGFVRTQVVAPVSAAAAASRRIRREV